MQKEIKYNHELNKAIQESGVRKNFLAQKVGITPQKLSLIISGQKAATSEEKIKLAEALNCKEERLFMPE